MKSHLPHVLVNCDGAIEPSNPGGHAVGGWIARWDDGDVFAQGVVDLGRAPELTNNIAEFAGVLAAIDYLARDYLKEYIYVRSDSRLIVGQLNDVVLCNASRLRTYRDQIWKLCEVFWNPICFQWVPREQNREADEVARSLYG